MGGSPVVRFMLVVAVVAAGFGAPTMAQADPTEPNGGQLVDACHAQADNPMCRQLEQLTRNGAQACRFGGTPDEVCSAVDGREYSEPAMAEFEASAVGRALRAQARLDDRVPIGESLIPATHNSYNSAAYYPTVSGLDHNQVASMTDQLRMGMRSLEVDVHWFPSPYGDPEHGGFAPILCHGNSGSVPSPQPVHVGCTVERHLRDGLAEIRAWLDANPDDFLLLYLENQLDGDPTAHEAAADTIGAELGELVYPTENGACGPLPADTTQRQVLDSGARVLVVGDPAPSDDSPWCEVVHDRFGGPYAWNESKSGTGDDFDCMADRGTGSYGSTFRRFFEDSTWLGATFEATGVASPGEITAAETRAMVECGVNLFGFDQLVPADPRLDALAWSWDVADGQPGPGHVAFRDAAGRFHATDDESTPRRFACVASDGTWFASAAVGAWTDGHTTCADEDAAFSVPHTGFENTLLAAGEELWLNYASTDGRWTPDLDPSSGGAGGLARAQQTPGGDHLVPHPR